MTFCVNVSWREIRQRRSQEKIPTQYNKSEIYLGRIKSVPIFWFIIGVLSETFSLSFGCPLDRVDGFRVRCPLVGERVCTGLTPTLPQVSVSSIYTDSGVFQPEESPSMSEVMSDLERVGRIRHTGSLVTYWY